MCLRILLLVLATLLAFGCGDSEPVEKVAAVEATPSAPIVYPKYERHESKIPRLIMWPPDFGAEVDPEFRAEAEYFVTVVRTVLGHAPEPVIEAPFRILERLLPHEDSPLRKPMGEYDDDDLSQRADSGGAQFHLRVIARKENGRPTISFKLLETKRSATLLEWTAEGDWDEQFAEFAKSVPDIARKMGVDPTEKQEVFLSKPITTHGTHFVAVAKAIRENGDLTRALSDWHAAEGENYFLNGLILTNEFLEDIPGAEERAMAALTSSTTLNPHLGRRMGDRLWQKKRIPEALALRKLLHETYPEHLGFAIEYGTLLDASGQAEEAVALWDAIAQRYPTFSEPKLLAGLHFLDGAMNIQAGRTSDMITGQEQEVWVRFLGEAHKRLELAYRLNPHDSFTALQYGTSSMYSGGNHRLTMELLLQSLELNPHNHRAIRQLYWLCAPGFSSMQAEGRELFHEYKDQEMDGYLRLQTVLPLTQIFAGRMQYDDADLHRFAAEEPELALEYVRYIHKALATPEAYSVFGKDMQEQMTGMHVSALILLHWWLPPENKEAVRQIHKHLIVATAYPRARSLVAYMTEMAGELETADELYRSLGAHDSTSFTRLLVVQAKRGDVKGALQELETHISNPDIGRLRMEVLTQGTAAQRKEAVEIGKAKGIAEMDRYWFAVWLDACLAAGDYETGRNAIAERYKDKPLDPSVAGRWKVLSEKLGVSAER